MPRRSLPRILRNATRTELVIIPATQLESSATEGMTEVDTTRAAELAGAATHGGLWVVQGDRFARIVTGRELLGGSHEYLPERQARLLFDGGPPLARTLDLEDPVDLMVPVAGWDSGFSYYFHSDAAFFKQVPVVRKVNHKLEVRRGRLDDDTRKLARRRMVNGQVCGVLRNELGGSCIVPDGEVVTDMRAVFAERFRFIIDGLRDLSTAAEALEGYAEQFRDAADAGWVLERPVDNSFVYAINRRRLRTLLPLPAPGALVPVPDAALPVVAAGPSPTAGLTAAVPALSVSAELLDHQPLALGAGPETLPIEQALVDRFAAELVAHAHQVAAPDKRGPGTPGMTVLRATTFRRPRGRLMRLDTPSRMVHAIVSIGPDGVSVVRGGLTTDLSALLEATLEESGPLLGTFGVCQGAFGFVLAELGSPMRAIQSMSSSMSYAHLLDGVQRLDEAAARLRRVAADLQRLAQEGWTLTQPIAGFWLRLRPPLREDAG